MSQRKRRRHDEHDATEKQDASPANEREADAAQAASQLAAGADPLSLAHSDYNALQETAGNRATESLANQSQRAPLDEGRQLPGPIRSEMESMFGESLDEVRVHDDAQAAQLAAQHQAQAVASGQDIAFAPGRFQPGTLDGDALIAHEVAHTVQQRGVDGPAGKVAAFREDRSGETGEEREADTAAATLCRRRLTGAGARMRVQRNRATTALRRGSLCSSGPSLEQVKDGLGNVEELAAAGAAVTESDELRGHLLRVEGAMGQAGSHIETAINAEQHGEDTYEVYDSWKKLSKMRMNDEGGWTDSRGAAREFGRLFAATGRLMEATGVGPLAVPGRILASAGNFFVNMHDATNLDAYFPDQAQRGWSQGSAHDREVGRRIGNLDF